MCTRRFLTSVIVTALGVMLAMGDAISQPDGEGADRQDDENRGADEGRADPPAPTPPPRPPPVRRVPDAKPLPQERNRVNKRQKVRRSRRSRGPSRYSRARAVGIYHKAHVMAGVFKAEIATMQATGVITREDKTALMVEMDLGYLGVASMYGNFHGIETFVGLVSAPFDMYWGFGMPLTLLNLGSGGPGSLRIGGSFGVGLGYKHAFAYVRGRAAAVIVPDTIDIEASYRWIPDSADSIYGHGDDFNDTNLRLSAFYRPSGKKSRAWELFVQMWERERLNGGEPSMDLSGTVKTTVLGVGMTFL